jgi:hypothetical protein
MTESRKVDGYQVRVFGESQPGRLKREQALRPLTPQEGVIVAVLAFRVTDRQPVDRPEPRMDGAR